MYEEWPVQVASSHHSTSGRASYVPEGAWGSFDWVKSGATDSAAAATTLGTGVKTNNGVIGFDREGNRLLTVGEQAKAVGKKVGLVTSVPFNHATPAGFIAHNSNRNDYRGLATEMIDSGIDVIMGGGHPNFTDAHTSRASNWTWISQQDFSRVSSGQTDFSVRRDEVGVRRPRDDRGRSREGLRPGASGRDPPVQPAGLANKNVLPGTDAYNDVPSLETMTRGALNVLDEDEDGFFLMVEGGAVDWAGHANQTTRVIEEQIDFNESVEAVNAWVEENSSWDETLVIVTADHETGYLAGPGASPTWTPMTGAEGELPNVSWHSGSHTNQLVPFFAKGAGSEELLERADQWDVVRGAYLDNTDVGEVVFDVLGLASEPGDSGVALEASVDSAAATGTLSLAVDNDVPVAFAGAGSSLEALLPSVTVTDTRSEVQAQGQGWTVAGSAADFRAGNRVLDAGHLTWLPGIVSTETGASAGPQASLGTPATLAEAGRVGRVGSTVVDAELTLDVPDDARNGRYGSEITLTLFAQD